MSGFQLEPAKSPRRPNGKQDRLNRAAAAGAEAGRCGASASDNPFTVEAHRDAWERQRQEKSR